MRFLTNRELWRIERENLLLESLVYKILESKPLPTIAFPDEESSIKFFNRLKTILEKKFGTIVP